MGLDVGHIAGVHYLLDVLDECLETCVASGTSGEMVTDTVPPGLRLWHAGSIGSATRSTSGAVLGLFSSVGLTGELAAVAARQGSRVLTAGLDCLYGTPPARGLHAPRLPGQVSPTIR